MYVLHIYTSNKQCDMVIRWETSTWVSLSPWLKSSWRTAIVRVLSDKVIPSAQRDFKPLSDGGVSWELKKRNNYTLCTNVIQIIFNIFTDPAIVLSMIMVSFIFLWWCVWSWVEANLYSVFIACLYLCCCWRSNY